MMRLVCCSLLLVLAGAAQAASAPTNFPDGSANLAPDALRAAIADKVFSVQAAEGPQWRWQFKGNGYFFINIGNFSDSGKWSTQGSSLCTEGHKIAASCNAVREKDGTLYLKRDSGEIVKMVAQ
jgi:hypothetical protein